MQRLVRLAPAMLVLAVALKEARLAGFIEFRKSLSWLLEMPGTKVVAGYCEDVHQSTFRWLHGGAEKLEVQSVYLKVAG
jgi:hypothetical protein